MCVLPCRSGLADETVEPPQRLTLQVNGKSVAMESGEEVKLSGTFQDPTIRVTASPTRQFAYGGISFDYPANFTWEADIEGSSYRSWIMSGHDCGIMYFAVEVELSPEDYAESMQEQFGRENTRVEPITQEFGTLKLQGKRVLAKVAGKYVAQDAFAIPGPPNQRRLLVLQGMPSEDEPDLEEPKRVLELLSKSLRLTK